MTFRSVLAGLAALLVAAPAAVAASPPFVPVEEGVVEHRIRAYKAEASYTAAGVPRHVRTEEFIARGRYHSRTTDIASGALVAETVQEGSRVTTWTRGEGTWTGTAPSSNGRARLVGHSFATEAAINRSVIDAGWYRQTAETADSISFESTPEAPSDGDNTTTLVVRRSDFTVLRRETLSRLDGGGWFRQTEETELAETLRSGNAPRRAFAATKAKLSGKSRTAKKRKRSAKRSYRR